MRQRSPWLLGLATASCVAFAGCTIDVSGTAVAPPDHGQEPPVPTKLPAGPGITTPADSLPEPPSMEPPPEEPVTPVEPPAEETLPDTDPVEPTDDPPPPPDKSECGPGAGQGGAECSCDAAGQQGADCAEPWLGPDWAYRRPIAVASAKVDGEHHSFPVLVHITDEAWRSEANGGHVAQPGGGDIAFTAQDGTTRLDHELEAYDAARGQLTAWVKVPVLSAAEDTVMYMYYGNPGVEEQANPTGVWDAGGQNQFGGVWHLNETNTVVRWDSTGHLNVCAPINFDIVQFFVGLMGGGDLLDGVDDWLACPHRPGLDSRDALTVSAWIRLTRRPDEDEWSNVIWKRGSYGLYIYGRDDDHTTLGFQMDIDGDEHDEYNRGRIDITPRVWHHLALTYDGTRVRAYVDGKLDFGYPVSGRIDVSDSGLTMGEEQSKDGIALPGALDEVRVVKVARSPGWIATSYRNQATQGSFVTVGAEQAR